MIIDIDGRNYNVTRSLNRLKQGIEHLGLKATISYFGSGYAQSKAHAHVCVDSDSCGMWSLLEDVSVHVEVAEEAPGVIFKYVSPMGAKTFRSNVEICDIDTDISAFEDEEMYCERMGKVGILV